MANVLDNFEASSNTMGLHTNWLKTKIQNVCALFVQKFQTLLTQAVESVSKFRLLTWALTWTLTATVNQRYIDDLA